MTPDPIAGAARGGVRLLLRVEGLLVLAGALVLYARGGHSWMLLALLFLAPDLSFAGYLAGPRVGAAAYNALHSYVGPILAALLAVLTGRPPVLALVWFAHIGFDRALGYGLKYASGFGATHLGAIGRAARPTHTMEWASRNAPGAPHTPPTVPWRDAPDEPARDRDA